MKSGYDLPLIRKIQAATSAAVVASGGAGKLEHFYDAVEAGANILLAASVFHFNNWPRDKQSLVTKKGSIVEKSQALALLQRARGDSKGGLRPGQWEAIDALVNHRRKLLLVERTGWGKSLIYFIGTRVLRDRGQGPTLIVPPLLALMRNQRGDHHGRATCSTHPRHPRKPPWERVKKTS